MKGIIILIFLTATFSLSAQELKPPVFKGKTVKIKKVLKKYAKDKKLYAIEFRYLKDYLLFNQYDSTQIVESLGQPAKVENNNGQTVLIYNCFVNYEVRAYLKWQQWLYLYLDDDNRISELKSID